MLYYNVSKVLLVQPYGYDGDIVNDIAVVLDSRHFGTKPKYFKFRIE